MTISFGCLVCVGGTLLAVLLLYAGATSSPVSGGLTLFLFAVGMSLPFLLAAMAFDKVLPRFMGARRLVQYSTPVAGAVMLVLGAAHHQRQRQSVREVAGLSRVRPARVVATSAAARSPGSASPTPVMTFSPSSSRYVTEMGWTSAECSRRCAGEKPARSSAPASGTKVMRLPSASARSNCSTSEMDPWTSTTTPVAVRSPSPPPEPEPHAAAVMASSTSAKSSARRPAGAGNRGTSRSDRPAASNGGGIGGAIVALMRSGGRLGRGVALLAAALLLAACASGSSSRPRSSPASIAPTTARASQTAAASVSAVTAFPACADDESSAASGQGWAEDAPTTPNVMPVIVSSRIAVGPSRLLYGLMGQDFEVLSSPGLSTELLLFALDRDPARPAFTADGSFLDTGTGRGLYRAAVTFSCFGTWGAEIVATPEAGDPVRTRVTFRVAPADSTPAIGAPAPRSESLTASTSEDLGRISTDPEPDPEAYRLTVAEAVSSGRPSVIFFATPAFCQSGVCGPTVELVKRVVADHRDAFAFVMVEPYRLRETSIGLQPELDEQGRLRPVSAVTDYGIAVEPYLFVVGADGNVAAKFELVVGEDELRGALQDVLSIAAGAG